MKLCMYLAALLILLFFSSTYAVDTSFYPDIDDVTSNTKWTNLYISASANDSDMQYSSMSRYTWNKVLTISFKEDERINTLVQVAFNHCINRLWAGDHKKNWYNYSCENLILVWTAENWWWHRDRVSPTSDYWLCQLHYKRHKNFIDSEEFKDPINQIEYCQEVWEDAYKKWRMPWMAYGNRNAMKERFIISQ